MRRCGKHPHVCELLSVMWVLPDDENTKGEAALVMELCKGGGLFERLCSSGPYSEHIASAIMRQMALAVYHLHSRGIVHRDIKPENVVFDSERDDSGVKLIDFGTAIALDKEKETVSGGGRIGTWSYWAPEQLDKKARAPPLGVAARRRSSASQLGSAARHRSSARQLGSAARLGSSARAEAQRSAWWRRTLRPDRPSALVTCRVHRASRSTISRWTCGPSAWSCTSS